MLFSFENSGIFYLGESINDGFFPEKAADRQKSFGVLPSLGRVSGAEKSEVVFVNGFPLNTLGGLVPDFDKLAGKPTDYTSITPLHPYFLKSGGNSIQVFSGEPLPDRSSEITVAIAEWDYVYGKTLQELNRLQCSVRSFADKQIEDECVFFWENSSLSQWTWQKGVPLQNDQETKQQLHQEVVKLHNTLSKLSGASSDDEQVRALKEKWEKSTEEFINASEWRGKPYVFIDQVLEAATKLALPENDFGTLVFQPLPELDALQLEIFAGGTLAKLHNKYNHSLLSFTSNLADGPRGRSGDSKLSFDLWYRKNDGQWELDAIYPREAPNTWSGFLMNFNDLENLFRLTNF